MMREILTVGEGKLTVQNSVPYLVCNMSQVGVFFFRNVSDHGIKIVTTAVFVCAVSLGIHPELVGRSSFLSDIASFIGFQNASSLLCLVRSS